jgi:transposase
LKSGRTECQQRIVNFLLACGSRNTVRKVLRSGETSFEYERVVQPRPKLGRWAAELDGLLSGNAGKSAREQLTLIRIFEELRGRGYDGGYDAVRRYARRWSKERGQSTAAAYVPLSFAPGEAYQFDWSMKSSCSMA